MNSQMNKKSRLLITIAVWVSMSSTANALNTGTITASSMSPSCIEYRVSGVCYWLHCTWRGCSVKASVRVSHYVPDAVVTSYSSTGESPWTETAMMGTPIAGIAQSGGSATTSQANENNVANFNNVDVIGHPSTFFFNDFGGYSCEGAGTPFVPYFISTLDVLGWRHNIPETVYPESLTVGMREIGSRQFENLWGNVYPRGGFTHQADNYKAAAITAQRAGDIVTRKGQPHIYMSLIANAKDGYWPAGALKENDKSTGKWQELTPTLSLSCNAFPDNRKTHDQAKDGGYAWALWRPYSCCKRQGQVFLGSVEF